MHTLSPSSDTRIAHRYSAKSLDVKTQNKTALQEELGWPAEPKRAMVCLPMGMTDELGGELFMEVLPGLLSLPIELVVLGKGSSKYGTLFTELAASHSHRVAIIPPTDDAQRRLFAAADITLFLTDPSAFVELSHALAYGTVPVAPACTSLENYNPNQERGDAFLFNGTTSWDAFAAMVRALETYRFPFDWHTIQRHCMRNEQSV